MDGADLPMLVETGNLLYATKVFMVSMHGLWIYDYFLTLADEIKYAWSGRKSWVFALFIANRYTPVLHLIWVHTAMFSYTKPFCQATKWVPTFHAGAGAIFAQVAIALRIYAVTRRNKLLGGALSIIIITEFVFWIYSVISIGMGSLLPLPEIDLDVFKVCIYKRWRLGELLYVNLLIAFDVLSFSIILVAAKRLTAGRYPGIPSILDTIRRDATVYFMLIFASQLLFQIFLLSAPADIQLLPAIASTILTPMMASRLMLSLKEAAVEPRGPWSHTTTPYFGGGRSPEDGALHLVPPTLSGPHEHLETRKTQSEEDIELESTLRLPRLLKPSYS